MAKNNNGRQESFEKTLFKTVDKLRKNMDAAEYKHILLGGELKRFNLVLSYKR